MPLGVLGSVYRGKVIKLVLSFVRETIDVAVDVALVTSQFNKGRFL